MARIRMGAATRVLLWMGLALWPGVTPAWADGVVLVPSQALHLFSEQYQGAVVSVNPDRTADIDLFISLASSSRKPEQVHFLLPLQTVPTKFVAREQTQRQFTDRKLNALDEVLQAGVEHARRTAESVGGSYAGCSLLLGPWALAAGASLGRKAASFSGRVPPVTPVLSAVTEHTRADLYPSLQPDQLAALAGLPGLPERVRQTLKGYAGRPFALVELRLIPSGPDMSKREPGRESASPPGVLFSFRQQLLPNRDRSAYRYGFPLGTGQGWANPIAATLVYVTAPENVNLRVTFPDRPLPERPWASGSSSLRRFARGAADHQRYRQVYAAAYSPDDGGGNPSRDVGVELRTSGVSELVARRDQADRRARLLSPIFPFLALAAWLTTCRLLLPWGRDKGILQRAGAIILYWMLAEVAQLGFVIALVVSGGALVLLGMDDTVIKLLMGLILLSAFAIAVWWGLREPGSTFEDALHRVPLAALVALLIYLALGYPIYRL